MGSMLLALFSKDANTVPGASGKQPGMLSRYLGGLLHPMIHAGYGAEFGQYGMWAEGMLLPDFVPLQ